MDVRFMRLPGESVYRDPVDGKGWQDRMWAKFVVVAPVLPN